MKIFNTLILISLGLLCTQIELKAQDASDFSGTVLRLSNTFPGGSARVRGIGGAQTALGGDISSASSNPAGLGFFNRSEFSLTPNFNFVSANTDYLDGSTRDEKLNFNFANLGVVLNYTKGDIVDSKWRGGNFGVSINRIADFHSDITYEGSYGGPFDFTQSAIDGTFVDNAGNVSFADDFAELAFETGRDDFFGLTEVFEDADNPGEFFVDRNYYAVDSDGNLLTDVDGNFIPAFTTPEFPTFQREEVRTSGASYQTSLAYGGNYDDKLYFGASVGIVTTSMEIERSFTEEPTEADLTRLTLADIADLTGIGINATFGLIGRPVAPLLIGVSYTTPTVHSFELIQDRTLTTEFIGNDLFTETISYTPFEYSVRTPSRLNAGLTYFFGKNGFVTADMERVDYGGGFLSNPSENFSFTADNDIINRFEAVYNIRTGVEFRFDKFRLRGGYAQLADPTDNDLDESQSNITLGGGIRTKNYFVDLGIVSTISGGENLITPYPGANLAEATINRTRIAVSLGWFF